MENEFDNLLTKENKTEQDRILIQCIATLCSHPNFFDKTPWEIYEIIKQWAIEIGY